MEVLVVLLLRVKQYRLATLVRFRPMPYLQLGLTF